MLTKDITMAALTEESLSSWRITYLPTGGELSGKADTVRAAYVTGQPDLPGWTLLKDHQHRIVKMVRDDFVADIERTEPGNED